MADSAEAEKAEKLAAAKKRFEELKKEKQKGQKPDTTKDKGKKGDTAKKKKAGAKAKEKEKNVSNAESTAKEEHKVAGDQDENNGKAQEENDDDEKEELKDDAAERAADESDKDTEDEETKESLDTVPEPASSAGNQHSRQPSLSIQSRMRSDSFRKGTQASPRSPSISNKGQSLPALTPDGDSMNEIYRKQTQRVEELEKENKQLSKDYETGQARQQKMEEELDELREKASKVAEFKTRADKLATKEEEISKLKTENASLQRQNAHLQSSAQKSSRKDTTSPSNNPSSPPPADLFAQIDSKTSTIENMEQEISNLRAQLAKFSTSDSGQAEQIQALEEKAARAERAAGAAQRELQDARKSLERASEKAVREGTERTSAETQIRTLQRELEESRGAHDEASKKVEQLNSKLAALTTLHKDTDARRQSDAKQLADARRQLDTATTETARLRAESARLAKKDGTGATDDEGLDELEDEARAALAARVRELEAEIFDLRRNVWRDRRRELQSADDEAVISPRGSATGGGGGFDEVDLMGGDRRSSAGQPQRRTSSFRTVLTSGIKAFTGDGTDGGTRGGAEDGLLEDDDDLAFDENAFRQAQEEDAKRRLERVRELKRGLSAHVGFRVDLVELRRNGGGGLGEIFDV